MPLLQADIDFVRSAVMADVENGGGPPTSQRIPDGASNAIFPDISEDARTGGLVEARQIHGVLGNTDTDMALGANIILAEPPNDPNVALTLVRSTTFARRPDLVRQVEAVSSPGIEFTGFLLGNHAAGVRAIQIGQRPGAELPGVNTTLVLVHREGFPDQVTQYVRVRRVTQSEMPFTDMSSGQPVDYRLQVASCEIYSPLQFAFQGSDPTRLYTRQSGKTITRRVVISDAGTFFSASRLTQPTAPSDLDVFVDSIYTQIIPNSRTDTPLVDQRPGGARTLTLTDAIGTLEVSTATHTYRDFVTEATRGYTNTFQLRPLPAPGTVTISYMVLNTWYTLTDDGAGNLVGAGGGAINYLTGGVSVTATALPDINSFWIVTWADTAPFTNVCAAGPITLATPPQMAMQIEPGANPLGMTIEWTSGGAPKVATVDAGGVISGDATGRVDGAAGRVLIAPTDWPDSGTGFSIEHDARGVVTQSYPSITVDAGGFANMPLDQEPVPGTINVSWYTAQKVSETSGANQEGRAETLSAESGRLGAQPNFAYMQAATFGALDPNRVIVRHAFGQSVYSNTTESSTSTTLTVKHSFTDDGAGGFGSGDGTANYSGKNVNLRLVIASGTTTTYKSDQETATRFNEWINA